MLTLQIAIILLLILLNGFFAMAEIALVSARPARLQPRVEQGSRGAQAALALKNEPSRFLATVQIGITVIAVLSGTFGEATLGDALRGFLIAQGGFLASYAPVISMAVIVIGISYLSIVFGELVPKRIALSHPEAIAVAVSRFMHGMARIGAPLERLLSLSTELILRLLPFRGKPPSVTDEEIGFMLREGVASGHIPQAETAIVEMALRLGDRRVSSVMTPRTRIEFLDLDDPPDELRRQIRDSSYSRFPVVRGGGENLVGIVQDKDLHAASLAGEPFDLKAALRQPLFLPNTVSVLRALEMFKSSGEPMALVVDEYGDLEGLVTLTDILEALVGDIPEIGETDQRIVRREDGSWLIDGMVGLDEVKQLLGVPMLPGEDPEFHTLGGYMMARLHRVPMVADRVSAGEYLFEVVDMDGRRVDRVLIMPAAAREKRG
jgi:putative hemolysin